VHANANQGDSMGGLILNTSGKVIATILGWRRCATMSASAARSGRA
jgi:hypothetical protein